MMDAIDILSIDEIPTMIDKTNPITKVGEMFSNNGRLVIVTKISKKFGSCTLECDLTTTGSTTPICMIDCPLGAGLKFKYVD